MRVYLPATVGMLQTLEADGSLLPVNGTAFALTHALREAYNSGSSEELEYTAMAEAARASLRLLASDDDSEYCRRVVVAADVDDVHARPDLDAAVVRLSAAVSLEQVAAVHVDGEDAEAAVRAAAAVIDRADLGDEDAELALGDAEDHELAWYAPQELPFLLELL